MIAQQPQPQQQQPPQQNQMPGRPAFPPAGPPGYTQIRNPGARWPMPPPGPIPQQRNFVQTGANVPQGSALIAQLTQPPSTQFPTHRLDGKYFFSPCVKI